ncbi:WD40 repeat-containing protein [Artemisia annua]|uniref:WD40 repeat-containing protein n=1 Tax=Artemisia annua TaxID=35608 RepID=A0A2U1PZQ9_ARTAN|nr:WD40 repeat-containing protein [Artemisia annua]
MGNDWMIDFYKATMSCERLTYTVVMAQCKVLGRVSMLAKSIFLVDGDRNDVTVTDLWKKSTKVKFTAEELRRSIDYNHDICTMSVIAHGDYDVCLMVRAQVLRVLDYSRTSRHLLVTSGDDGSVHLWDTTGRNTKVSAEAATKKKRRILADFGILFKVYWTSRMTKLEEICLKMHETPYPNSIE